MDPDGGDLSEHRRLVGEISGGQIAHEEGSVVGGGCDDQFEFEFALDLILDGLERLRAAS